LKDSRTTYVKSLIVTVTPVFRLLATRYGHMLVSLFQFRQFFNRRLIDAEDDVFSSKRLHMVDPKKAQMQL